MYDLVVEGGTFLPMVETGKVIQNGRLIIAQGKIHSLEVAEGPLPPSRKVLNAAQCLVLPGFLNTHTHLGMTLYRGLADDVPFDVWLQEFIFPLEKKWASPEIVYLASLLGCVEMIRSGTIFFNDMYYFEEQTARAAHETGLRALLGITFIHGHLPENRSIASVMAEFSESLKSYPLVAPALAPHSLYSLSAEKLMEIAEVATTQKLRVNMHVSETQSEVDECFQKTGKTPVAYLESLGFWKLPITIAHAVVVNENDRRILGNHHVGVAHNPESNLKLGNRIAPVAELREARVNVGLGTDSVLSNNNLDLLQEATTAARLQTFKYGPGRMVAEDFLTMLTTEGAAAVGLDKVTGRLAPGLSADFIVIDTNRPHLQPLYDPFSQLIYSAGGADVRDVVVAGKLLMEAGKILCLDEGALLAEVRSVAKKIGASQSFNF